MKQIELSIVAACMLFATSRALATILYVDLNNPTPASPYTSWATAATNIQDAVDAAVAGDEVVVTNGIYTRGGRAVGTNLLVSRVLVDKPLTLRSVNGPEVTVIRGLKVAGTIAGCGDGAVRCVSLANGASLTGFTLINGATRIEGDSQLEQGGGGVWCESQTAAVSNCVVTGNGGWYGGGAAGGTLYTCTLTNNSAGNFGGGAHGSTLNGCSLIRNSARLGEGGGAYLSSLINCSLSNNLATTKYSSGGGVSESTLDNCVLFGNSAATVGGAYSSTLKNSTLANNSATTQGGGASYCTLNNCNLTGNSAVSGGGAYSSTLANCTVVGHSAASDGGGVADYWIDDFGLYLVTNCIVYYNSAVDGPNYSYNKLRFCCTTPMPAFGSGNITNAPLFVDYAEGNLGLHSNSPCINAGQNTYVPAGPDLDGNPRITGSTVDIGAYEFQSPASVLSYAWAQQYGLPTDGSADYLDSDSDQLNNWQEWIAGTVPTDALSGLRLLNPTKNGAGILVSWRSVSTRTYFLERATNLGLRPEFSLVTSNIVGQPGTTSYTDTAATGLGPFFYRVGIQQ